MQGRGVKGVGRFSVPIDVANRDDLALVRRGLLEPDQVRRVTIPGVVDSGAAKLILPKSVVEQLGLDLAGKVKVRYADGRIASRATAPGAHVTLLGREGDFTAIVEPKWKEALIGAIILEDLDLLVDCLNHRLVPRDPQVPFFEID